MRFYRAIAEYYDAENSHHEMLRRDYPFFLRHLTQRNQDILELGVGTARAAIPIVAAGHRVVGVDHSADMLAIARRKREAAGIDTQRLSLVRADILKLNLDERFDWICIFFNTFLGFTSLEQQDQALTVVRRHLKREGKLWLDILQPNMGLMAEESSNNLDSSVFFVPRFNRTVFKSTEVRRNPKHQSQRVTFHYKSFDDDGQEHHQRTQFDLTFIFPRELQLLVERNGLKISKLYGDYDGSRLSPESPRIIACCVLA